MNTPEMKETVRVHYRNIADSDGAACCCTPAASCCGPPPGATVQEKALEMGYSESDLAAVPDGANLGLGCGNPQAIAALRSGEVVIDLGNGAGFDCFLAARQVGPSGYVIGVDMTHETLKKARENAAKIGAENIEFRLGELEHLPVADNTADVILSNCVINLVPDKRQVFREAFRTLKPGGRLAISEFVNSAPLPAELPIPPSSAVVSRAPRRQIKLKRGFQKRASSMSASPPRRRAASSSRIGRRGRGSRIMSSRRSSKAASR